MIAARGNRCGHDPRHPILTKGLLRKGPGGLPRILSLAAERAKYGTTTKKMSGSASQSPRRTRSERREACQQVIEDILAHLDLASLCLGIPSVANSFIDVDMDTPGKGRGSW